MLKVIKLPIDLKKGYIHSFESFGTKDGPGIRYVLFMQGCPLRCLYCHNPDTWNIKNHKYELSPEEVFDDIRNVKEFIRSGGITVSGGEPLLQSEFITELFQLAKNENLHTALDTSGFLLNEKIKELLEYTDLVLLDIKHIDSDKYKTLTSQPLKPTKQFLSYLHNIGKPVWLRYVLVPGYTDDSVDLNRWAEYISEFKNVERVEVLPFHQMAVHKWNDAGLKYQLAKVNPATVNDIQKAETVFRNYGLPVE